MDAQTDIILFESEQRQFPNLKFKTIKFFRNIISKIISFYNQKMNEISRRIRGIDQVLNKYTEKNEENQL